MNARAPPLAVLTAAPRRGAGRAVAARPPPRAVPDARPIATPETRPAYLSRPEETITASPVLHLALREMRRPGGEVDEVAEPERAGPEQAGPDAVTDAETPAPGNADSAGPEASAARRGDTPGPVAAAPAGAHASARAEEQEGPPAEAEIPTPETGLPALPWESLGVARPGAGFGAAMALDVDAERGADAPAEAASPEIARFGAVFAQAAEAARRLHDTLLADAGAALGAAEAAHARRADRRQDALADGLRELDAGLAAARAGLDDRVALTLLTLASRAEDGRALIRRAARRAFGTLAAARRKVEGDLTLPRAMRDAVIAGAWRHVGTTATQSVAALGALRKLGQEAGTKFGENSDPVTSAVNEAIADRLPDRVARRGLFYTEEMLAQIGWLTQNFLPLPGQFAAAFQDVDRMVANTAVAGPRAVSATRTAALRQIDAMERRIGASVRAGRAQAEAGLVRQHAMLRGQLFEAHRNRARAETAAARRRAEMDARAAQGLAAAQGPALDGMAQGLRRERRRPRRDFARVVISVASGYARRVAATEMQQRPRLARTATDGRTSLDRQSDATAARLGQSAARMAARLDETATLTADALAEQTGQGAAELPARAEPVAHAIDAYLPPVGLAYAKLLARLYAAIGQTAVAVGNVIAAEPGAGGGGKGGKQGQAAAPSVTAPKILPPIKYVDLARGIAADATSEENIADLIARARTTVPKRMREKAFAVYNNLSHLGTNVLPVMEALRAITRRQGKAITALYPGEDIRWDIRVKLPKMLSAGSTNVLNVQAALNYLDGNDIQGAMLELRAAVNYSNENARITAIQKSLRPERWAALEEAYGGAGGDLAEVREDLGEQQGRIFDAMAREATASDATRGQGFAEANAILLRQGVDEDRKTRGEKGVDAAVDRIAGAARDAALDPIAGGDPLGLQDSEVAEELRRARWLQTKQAFANLDEVKAGQTDAGEGADAALVRYATQARDYTVFVPDGYSEAGGHYEIKTEGVRDEQKTLISAIVAFGPDSDEAAGARLLVETTRPGGAKPDRFDMALHNPELDAREGESDAERDKAMAKREQAARERQARVLTAYERYRTALAAGPVQANPAQIRAELKGRIATQCAGDPAARAYLDAMLDEPSRTARAKANDAAIAYAMTHEEQRADTLKRTFGRMTRDEIDTAIHTWDDANGGRGTFHRDLNLFGKGSWWSEKLSGDVRNEVEIATFGVARDDRERAEIARHAVQQQIRDAGWLGRVLAHGDYARMEESRDALQTAMGVEAEDFDALGRLRRDPVTKALLKQGNFTKDGKFQPRQGMTAETLDAAMQLATLSAEAYRVQTDRIANAVTMALVVIAAVVTTALTGGAAASIWIPMLVTFGAGMVGMGLSAAIKGDRYSRQEMWRDFVVTLVQTATAGLGAAAGAALRGGVPALRAVASRAVVSEKVLERFVQITTRRAMRQSLTLAEEALIAGGSNAMNAAAAAAMDPATRLRGKSGEEALNAGLRGFFGGALGAAVMRPIAGVGKIAGTPRAPPPNMGYGQALARRALGTGASNATTRAFEMGWEHATGRQRMHETGAFLDEVKASFAQGVFQSAAEHVAGQATDARRGRRFRPDEPATQRPVGMPDTEAPPRLPVELAPVAAAAEELRPPPPAPEAPAAAPRPRGATGEEAPVARSLLSHAEAEATLRAGGLAGDPNSPLHVPEGNVWMPARPDDVLAAMQRYHAQMAMSPDREVAIFHNPATGEYIVVQGTTGMVGVHPAPGSPPGSPPFVVPAPAGMSQPWKTMLAADIGRWEMQAHYHPIHDGVHPILRQTPSGGGGDFGALIAESHLAGHTPRRSSLHHLDNVTLRTTEFGYEPTHPTGPLWVTSWDHASGRNVTNRYASLADYDSMTQAMLQLFHRPSQSTAQLLPPPLPGRGPGISGTASAVPDGMFTALAPAARQDAASVAARINVVTSRAPLRELAEAIFPPVPGRRISDAASDNSLRLPLAHPDGTSPPMRVHVALERPATLPPDWPHENGLPAPARYVEVPVGKRGADHAFVVQVSPHTDPDNVMPALAHELMELRIVATARAAGAPIDPARQPNALARGAPEMPLSAHDMGRVEQLRVRMAQVDGAERAVQHAIATGRPQAEIDHLTARRDALRADARALVHHMGLIDDPAGPGRMRRIEDHPLTSPEARATLGRAVDDARAGRLGGPAVDDDFDAMLNAAFRDDAPPLTPRSDPARDPATRRAAYAEAARTEATARAVQAGRAADAHLAATRVRLEGPETPRPMSRENDTALRRAVAQQDLLARLRIRAPGAVDAVLGAETPRRQQDAMRALYGALRGAGVPEAEARAALSLLRRTVEEPGMRAAIDHRITVVGRAANTGEWPPGQAALRAWVTERPGLAGVASLPPGERAALFQRYLARRPPWRWGPGDFERYWRAVERSNLRPVVSEIEGTRLLDEGLGMQVLKGGPGRDRFGAGGHGANQPGIDMVGFIPPPEGMLRPARVDVVLGDDKAYRSRDPRGVRLDGVSALVENLTRNLGTEAAAQRAALAAQERQGFPPHPDHDQAIRQMENAARRLAALDAEPGTPGRPQRFSDPAYIARVRAILNEERIQLVVTSAYGNVTRLSEDLARYGFRIQR